MIDGWEVLTLKTYQLELDVYQKMYACVMSCCCLCHLHFQLRNHLLHHQSYALQDLWKPSDPETCAMLILVLQEFWNSRCIITIIRKYLKTNWFLFDIDEKEIPRCIKKASKQGCPRFLYFNCPAGRRRSALWRGGLTNALQFCRSRFVWGNYVLKKLFWILWCF